MPPFHLLPRDERFFGMFGDSARNVAAGVRAVSELLSDYTDVERKVGCIKELEHVGDQMTHSIFDALNRAFVTPFDREDIARLAVALDDVLDQAEEAARRCHIYKIEQPTALARELCRVLVEQCRVIEQAVPLLDGLREEKTLRQHIVELHRLENEADDLLNRALANLYEGVVSVPELARAIQWSDIYNLLERATDRAEDVAVALEAIVVKHA
jgi:predicted phosphate transport protein (TIGR00153 family)